MYINKRKMATNVLAVRTAKNVIHKIADVINKIKATFLRKSLFLIQYKAEYKNTEE